MAEPVLVTCMYLHVVFRDIAHWFDVSTPSRSAKREGVATSD